MISSEQKVKIIKYARFVFGLLILVWLFFITPILANQDFITVAYFYIMSPFVVFAIPSIAVSVYFLVTTKIRFRLDVVLLLLLLFLLFSLGRGVMPENISGDAELQVTVMRQNGAPVVNIEVDVAKETGQPPQGGFRNTNADGVATFKIKPGDYVIYFNQGNFPADLMPPPGPVSVQVGEGELSLKTIILETKK
ncbi:MAG: hypothetical protein WC445_01835 [Patescibacteria group bacterium]